MQAGKLRHKVTIQRQVAASPNQHSTGEPDEPWTAYLSDIWGAVEPLNGRELFAAQEFHSEVSVRIRIRYREGITAAMRVLFDSRYYQILYVLDPEERHRELQLLCTQGIVPVAT